MRVLHRSHHRRRRRLRILRREATALVVIAHGSRSGLANDEVRALAVWLETHGAAPAVSAAFLEQAEPTFEQAVDRLVDRGVREIRVFPLFLNSGRHVSKDVPALVAAAQAKHPALALHTLNHLGGAAGFNRSVLAAIVNVPPPDAT